MWEVSPSHPSSSQRHQEEQLSFLQQQDEQWEYWVHKSQAPKAMLLLGDNPPLTATEQSVSVTCFRAVILQQHVVQYH